MNTSKLLLLSALGVLSAVSAKAELVSQFDMTVQNGMITDLVSGETFDVEGHFAPENVPGAVGQALRFDGYTSRVQASLGNILPENATKMTVSMWVALPCYPIIQLDTDTSEKTPIVSCLDTENKTGFGFFLGFNGKYSFKTYVGGWPVDVEVVTPLPAYQWNNLVAVIDCDARSVKLYNNGTEVGSARANGSISFEPCALFMGQGTESRMAGPFELMSFNGLIDDISIWNEALELTTIQSWKPENEPNLDIPASRFAEDLLRPRFHGMPAAGWTNECHGMYYSDGKFHLFFQKNGDGPYMARLHWGHITSTNLYDWTEEKIALAPGLWYDIKGCWSGCVFSDDIITGGKPNILYTAVDYAKAMIAQAAPETDRLDNWTKSAANPIISGRPSGLSDDFRDPYFFRSGSDAYIIVGTSKDGIGATTLHKYNEATKTWSNNGDIFFAGSSAALDGTFWEMPNITPMPDGKWLFTVTPLATSRGVSTLYWTGTIGSDGKFIPDNTEARRKQVELCSKEGFGLLSPTIYNHEGTTIALGIVPDKLSSQSNWNLGWAHCYSLPREWSLTDDGTLLQKPYSGLTGLRTEVMFEQNDISVDSPLSLAPVSGRAVEIEAQFEVGDAEFGFNIFKSSESSASISYLPAKGILKADFTSLNRLPNDENVYDGLYECTLPETPAKGQLIKLNIYIDHSILDIFINDKWATSIRVFPTDADADGIEAFALNGQAKVVSLKAWLLKGAGPSSSITPVHVFDAPSESLVDVYAINGIKVKSKVMVKDALSNLSAGIYIVNNRKYVVH